MHDGPENYTLATYAWVLGLSIWGGIASWCRKIRLGVSRAINFAEFIGEITTSALCGIITFYLAESAHIHQVTTAALVAVAGHMGSRLLFKLEQIYQEKLGIK